MIGHLHPHQQHHMAPPTLVGPHPAAQSPFYRGVPPSFFAMPPIAMQEQMRAHQQAMAAQELRLMRTARIEADLAMAARIKAISRDPMDHLRAHPSEVSMPPPTHLATHPYHLGPGRAAPYGVPASIETKLAPPSGLDLLSVAALELPSTPREAPSTPREVSSDSSSASDSPTNSTASSSSDTHSTSSPTESTIRKDGGKIYISSIREWDVLCGRGGRSNHHPGNKRYRQVVGEMKMMYRRTEAKAIKTDVSRAIVEHVCGYGGRFVKKDQKSGQYYVLTRGEARKKTSQALRETKELKWTL